MKRFQIQTTTVSLILFLVMLGATQAQYTGWKHSGSMYIITTPEGANLPASATVKNFPLLVRLNKDFFNFGQAGSKGEDIRFSIDGKPLAYQIEEWDAANGTAAIWVQIPVIKGNTRLKLKVHWGKAGAASKSNGKAVFGESNAYLAVWHMNGTVEDTVGATNPKDTGTTPSKGMIGPARYFPGGKGIFCGDKIMTFPMGSQPHSSSVWFRAEKPNTRPLSWGKEYRQGKVQMWYRSPSQIRMDCYFSDGNVSSKPVIPRNKWVHVVHTYKKGESRIYVNGVLDTAAKSRGGGLNIERPARMWIGGWYNRYGYVGDIDEVRISGVTRSPEWIKLEYENQKPMQTLVGHLVRPGNSFAVSASALTVREGESARVMAKAGGAQKVYWILKRDGRETVVATDRYLCKFDAGRVTEKSTCALIFKAVYADKVKTKSIRITIPDSIPEPKFTLKAPSKWNGRDTIEVIPVIQNLRAMKKARAAKLTYKWNVYNGATIRDVAADKLLLRRSQYTGRITVELKLNNGGENSIAKTSIMVTEPKSDPWVHRKPGKDEKPEDGQFYARDDNNEGALHYNGTLDRNADSVFLKVYADDKPYKKTSAKPAADKSYALSVKLKPGLIKYKAVFGYKNGGKETIIRTVNDLVCGDAYLIDGQSNALATDTRTESPRETSEWIRSYGGPTGRGDANRWLENEFNTKRPNLWCYPVWKFEGGKAHRDSKAKHKAQLGWWGMVLAKNLVKTHKVPICIINAAVGGTRIDEHQRNDANPADLNTMYGRMLWRIRQAKLTHGIRAVLWHQGENDQGAAGPTGLYGWETYQQYFVELSAGWKRDMPNIRHYYIYQIWPNSCSMGAGNGDMLREEQRTLPRLFSNMDIMSTLGVRPPGTCHYPLAGWSVFAQMVQPMIDRDFYGKKPAGILTPPDLKRARYTSNDTIVLEFDQPVVWKVGLENDFYLDGEQGQVASGAASGNVVKLKLKGASKAKNISYLHEMSWKQDRLLIGKNGYAALTFCYVPLEKAR